MANDSNNNNSDSIWLYSPNFALTIVFALLYLIPTTIQFWQTFLKYKSWYFVAVFVGACLEVAGYIVRAVSVKNLSSIVRPPSPPHIQICGFRFEYRLSCANHYGSLHTQSNPASSSSLPFSLAQGTTFSSHVSASKSSLPKSHTSTASQSAFSPESSSPAILCPS